jgi:prepilin-type processing-associated H-X9-DG protein
VTSENGVYRGFGSFSVHTKLLPYLDQLPLYEAVNFSRPGVADLPAGLDHRIPHESNWTAARTALDVFLCPADSAGRDGEWAGTNYRANFGTAQDAPSDRPRPPIESQNGAFLNLSTLSHSDFADGLTNTAFFSEKPRGISSAHFHPFVGYWKHLSALYTTQDELVLTCASLTGQPALYQNDVGTRWFIPYLRFTHYNHNVGPNGAVPDCVGGWNNDDPAIINGSFAARSYHQSGVNVLFGDGRAVFVRNGLALTIWRALGTRAGGEAVSELP